MNRDYEFRRALAALWLRGAPIERLAKLDPSMDDFTNTYREDELQDELRGVLALKPRIKTAGR